MKIIKNIKFRLLVVLFLFLFTTFYGFGYLFVMSLKQSYQTAINNTLLSSTRDLVNDFAHQETNEKDLKDYEENIENIKKEFDLHIFYAQIITITKGEIKTNFKSYDLAIKEKSIPIDEAYLKTFKENQIYFGESLIDQNNIKISFSLLSKSPKETKYLLCAIPFEKHNPYIKDVEKTLWIWFSLLLVVILIVVYFMISKSLIAAKKLADEVNLIQIDGNFHKLNDTGISSEIDVLIKTFNTLIFNLQNSYKKVKNFGQNASHELKTPLTIIRGEIEVGLRKERSNEEYKAILGSVMGEVEQLQEIIEKILFLSSNADEDIIKNFEEVYIDEIISDAISEKMQFAKMKNIKLHFIELEPLTTKGSMTLLKIAINNILDNAIKYSNNDSMVNISLTNKILTIEDFGYGIPSNDLGKVLESFYRAHNYKHHIKGNGLGLAIVKSILDVHQFGFELQSIEGKGTKISITF